MQQFIAAQGDVTKVSMGLLHALDHSYFVGLMTNAIFGAILVASSDLGAAAFIVVLLTVGSGEGAKPFTHPVSFVAPIMGLAALLGIATYLTRLMGRPAAVSAGARA